MWAPKRAESSGLSWPWRGCCHCRCWCLFRKHAHGVTAQKLAFGQRPRRYRLALGTKDETVFDGSFPPQSGCVIVGTIAIGRWWWFCFGKGMKSPFFWLRQLAANGGFWQGKWYRGAICRHYVTLHSHMICSAFRSSLWASTLLLHCTSVWLCRSSMTIFGGCSFLNMDLFSLAHTFAYIWSNVNSMQFNSLLLFVITHKYE